MTVEGSFAEDMFTPDVVMRADDYHVVARAGARVADAQSITRSDVYVSKGLSSDKALPPTGVGFEIVPMAHPNRLDVGGALPMRLLLDGKLVPGVTISLHGPKLPDEEDAKAVTVTTDKDGKASIALPQGGTFLLLAHHHLEAADGPVTVKSYSANLTLAGGMQKETPPSAYTRPGT